MVTTERIAMIGGSFNPVTLAHIELGQIVKRELGEDCRVIYVPAPDRFLSSWKEMDSHDILSGAQRLELLWLAAMPHGFECSDCELRGLTSAKTFDTLAFLKAQYKCDRICYVCGSDKLLELERWYRADELVRDNEFFIIPRDEDAPARMIEGNAFLNRYRANFMISKSERRYPDFSATQVRESLKKGNERWRSMVPIEAQAALERMVGICH